MRNLLAVASIVCVFTFARPATRWILPRNRLDDLALTLAAGGLGVGFITLVPLWVMLVRPGGPAFAVAVVAAAGVWLAGLVAGRRRGARAALAAPAVRPNRPLARILLAAIGLCCAAIVLDAVYWPFDVGDALALYAPFGRHLYETATLPAGNGTYEAYPMLVPMAFALTHWVAGGVNEYLARAMPALMAVGAVGASGALGRAMGPPGTGLLAAALVAVTPVFGRWATTGYTDVPAAFFVGLTALFVWWWWEAGTRRTILLAGVAAGLAFWTKNSTLTLLPSLLWLVASRGMFASSAQLTSRAPWRDAGLLLVGVGATAGPWYARNLVRFGLLVPPTAFVDRARHVAATFGVMLRGDQFFGVSGWVFTAALVYALPRILTRRRGSDAWYVLMTLAAPFLAAWWWFASYDARFLMAVSPLLGALGALMLADAAVVANRRTTRAGLHGATAAGLVLVVAATAVSLRKTVEHKTILARTPWPDNAERHRIRVGGLYALAVALNQVPRASRVAGVPAMAGYYLDRSRFAKLDFGPTDEAPEALSGAYDYVVYRDLPGATPRPPAAAPPLLRTPDGYVLYATGRTALAHRAALSR
jgi:Dolichyl-phosphate-mannose-protein mannosyltransferase